MASILSFVPGPGRPMPKPPAGHKAAILFFPGVRYERSQADPRPQGRAPRTDGDQSGRHSTPRK
jgi:hypothetical protein